jgi:formate hydrogenlyase subunit 3/multisubunit Na+/H+ antiporter MnhD subunit
MNNIYLCKWVLIQGLTNSQAFIAGVRVMVVKPVTSAMFTLIYRIAFCTGVKKHLSDTEVEQNNISVVIIPLKIAFRRDTDSVFSCHYPVQCKHGLHIAEIKSRLHM